MFSSSDPFLVVLNYYLVIIFSFPPLHLSSFLSFTGNLLLHSFTPFSLHLSPSKYSAKCQLSFLGSAGGLLRSFPAADRRWQRAERGKVRSQRRGWWREDGRAAYDRNNENKQDRMRGERRDKAEEEEDEIRKPQAIVWRRMTGDGRQDEKREDWWEVRWVRWVKDKMRKEKRYRSLHWLSAYFFT